MNSPQEKTIKISKFLSLILRHKPETIGITLDPKGWADVDTLIELAAKHGKQIDRALLERIVSDNDKQRFAFNTDKSKIRANQGHSIAVNLALAPQKPPKYLYHGTAKRFVSSILSQRLIKQSRNHVHLSSDRATAIKVGTRHGTPVVLKIQSGKMHDASLKFYLAKNKVWLTDSVPAKYITFD